MLQGGRLQSSRAEVSKGMLLTSSALRRYLRRDPQKSTPAEHLGGDPLGGCGGNNARCGGNPVRKGAPLNPLLERPGLGLYCWGRSCRDRPVGARSVATSSLASLVNMTVVVAIFCESTGHLSAMKKSTQIRFGQAKAEKAVSAGEAQHQKLASLGSRVVLLLVLLFFVSCYSLRPTGT